MRLPAASAKGTRDATISIRLKHEELEEFGKLADAFGLSKSEAFRRSALAAMGQGPVLPMKNQHELQQIAEELRAIGVNLNQAVRAMNTGRVPDEESLKAELEDLRVGIEAVAEVLVVFAANARRKARLALGAEN